MAELPYLDGSTSAAPPIPFASGANIENFEVKSSKGAADGYAPLDSNSRVPLQNLPDLAALDAEVDSAISSHNSLTTSVHGIADTSNLELLTNKNTANGYAGLGTDGKISLSQLPDANALESEAIAFAIALG